MFIFFGEVKNTSRFLHKPMQDASVVYFDLHTNESESLLDAWVSCALERSCICPAGSSHANHRQDQAALTLLVLRSYENSLGVFEQPVLSTQHEEYEALGWSTFGIRHENSSEPFNCSSRD